MFFQRRERFSLPVRTILDKTSIKTFLALFSVSREYSIDYLVAITHCSRREYVQVNEIPPPPARLVSLCGIKRLLPDLHSAEDGGPALRNQAVPSSATPAATTTRQKQQTVVHVNGGGDSNGVAVVSSARRMDNATTKQEEEVT